jgi:hypothetical protein
VATDKAKFIKSEKTFHVLNGEIKEVNSLGTGVVAALKANDDFEALNITETLDLTQNMGTDPMRNGWFWYADGYAESSYYAGGNGSWGIYAQENMITRSRRHAGKTNRYGISLFRPPNVEQSGCCTTWGGIVMYPPAGAKVPGRKYRLSFDYRGYSGGHYMEVFQCYTVGWCTIGIGLPTAWYTGISAFDTDWEWRRFEYEFTVTEEYVNWTPGQNGVEWDPGTQYGDWSIVTYNGLVYRKPSWTGQPTQGVPPDQEYPAIWDFRAPATPGYFDIYNQIKIGFTYNTQNDRGTHVFVDNIQLEDITDNSGFKYDSTTFEANNFREETIHIFAKGTAFPALGNPDRFRIEGPRVLTINDTNIYTEDGGRGLRLTIFDESAPTSALFDQVYDTYGVDAARTELAIRLSTITDSEIWVLTSYDAIISNANLDAQMSAMGSEIGLQNGSQWSVYQDGVRATYAAVGRGQRIIKEDGSFQTDPIYKRKGVIDLWI